VALNVTPLRVTTYGPVEKLATVIVIVLATKTTLWMVGGGVLLAALVLVTDGSQSAAINRSLVAKPVSFIVKDFRVVGWRSAASSSLVLRACFQELVHCSSSMRERHSRSYQSKTNSPRSVTNYLIIPDEAALPSPEVPTDIQSRMAWGTSIRARQKAIV